jgi:tripartite ATP-independent transporter DctM subunit
MFAFGVGLGLGLLIVGVPIFIGFALGAGAICYYHLHVPWFALSQVMFESTTKYILLAIPLYILAANLMVQGGLAQRLADVFLGFVGHWKGGLAIALILTEGFFSAISGSILASIVTIGAIFMPLMAARGYDRAFVGALVASVAGIDALIPPSNAAIIYCAITGASVSKAFAAGIVPGVFQMLVLMGVCRVLCRDMTPEKRCSWRERWILVGRGGTALLMPVVILGGIYSGIFTPTEAAAVACLYAAVVSGLIHGELGWSKMWKALESTALTTSVIFAIIAASSFLSVILAYTRIPQQIAQWCLQMGVGPMSLLLAVALASLILGTFLEAVPNMYVMIPLVFPIALALKLDLMQLYVAAGVFIGIGLLTPPVCVGAYTAAAVAQVSPQKVLRELYPTFVLVLIGCGLLYIFVPAFSNWLPNLLAR